MAADEINLQRADGAAGREPGKMTEAGAFACDMKALSSEQRSRHHELTQLLRSALLKTHELDFGYDFEFPPDPPIYNALSAITPLEHTCCPFFTISIRLEQTSRLFWQLTGSDGVKQFIRMEFAEWFK